MKTTLYEKDGSMVAVFEGRVDTAAAPQCEQDLKPLNDCTAGEIVLDCNALEYISSSGLRLFLSVLKHAKPKGIHVFLTGMNADLSSVFKMTGLINLFELR